MDQVSLAIRRRLSNSSVSDANAARRCHSHAYPDDSSWHTIAGRSLNYTQVMAVVASTATTVALSYKTSGLQCLVGRLCARSDPLYYSGLGVSSLYISEGVALAADFGGA